MTALEKYINEQNKIISKDREETLIALGITEKEFAPDGKSSYLYNKYMYIDGEKRYYRMIAAMITDEEYAEVLKKKQLVDEIKKKEELERAKKYANQKASLAKKWIPVFEKPKSEWEDPEKKEKTPTGKSIMALILRGIAWASIVLAVIIGVITLLENPVISAIVVGSAIAESLLLFSLAEILDNLAEQTAILREGFVYKETNK